MLGKSPWAREFTQDQLEKLARYLLVSEAKQGSEVFAEGAKEAYMSIVIKGIVKVIKEDSLNRKSAIAEVGPGKTLGEMSLIDGWPRSASAVAIEDSTMLVLTKDNFEHLLSDQPQLGNQILMKLAGLLGQRLRMTNWVLVECLDRA
jgi:CRP-like cAMP-binding protein